MKRIVLLALLSLCLISNACFAAFFVESPKATDIFRPGANVHISWSRQEYPVLINPDSWNYADWYIVEVTGATFNSGVQTWTYQTVDEQFGEGPDRNWDFSVPCDAIGPYTIKITAYDRTFWSGAVVAVGGFTVLEIGVPLPMVRIKCDPKKVETIEIPNAQNNDMLQVYASAEAAITSATPLVVLYPEGAKNSFYYIDTFQTSHSVYMRYANNCTGSIINTGTATPLAVVVVPISISQFVPEEMQEVADLRDGKCDKPASYYELDAKITSPLEQDVKNIFETIQDSVSDAALVESPRMEMKWVDSNYIDFYFDTLIDGTIVQHAKICASNLPAEGGSCRVFTLYGTLKAKVHLYNVDKVLIYTQEIDCPLGKIRQVQVCKKMIPPPPDLIILCEPGYQPATVKNLLGYPGLEWHSTIIGDSLPLVPYVPYPLPVLNPILNQFLQNMWQHLYGKNNFGYSFWQNYQPESNPAYNYYINHVAANGRKSERVPCKVMVLPHFNPSTTEVKLIRPQESPDNNCDDPGSFYPLEKGISTNEYLGVVQTDLLEKYDTEITAHAYAEDTWEDPDSTLWYSDPGNVPTVCYDDLPEGGGTCKTYRKKSKIAIRVDVTSPLDPLVPIHKTYICEKIIRQVEVCKLIYPPKPQVITICKPSETETTICLDENQEQYANVYWENMDNLIDTRSGRCVTKDNWGKGNDGQPIGMESIYRYQVYNITENGKRSLPSIVYVIVLPNPPSFTNEDRPVFKPITAPEDSLADYCTGTPSEMTTYTDLDADPSAYQGEVQNIVDFINNNNSLFHIDAHANVKLYWEPAEHVSHPSNLTNINRVCFGNLPDPENSSREYYGYFHTDFFTKFYPLEALGPQYKGLTDTVAIDTGSCDLHIRTITVFKAPISGETGEQCKPILPSTGGPVLYADCQRLEPLVACPGESYQIGPDYDPGDSDYQITHTWTEPFGVAGTLDDLAKRQPVFTYVPIVLQAQKYYKYELNIHYSGNPVRPDHTYCVAVYTCDYCEGEITRKPGEAQPVIRFVSSDAGMLELMPNPASSELNVAYLLGKEKTGILVIYNTLGQEIERLRVEDSNFDLVIDLNKYKNGTYLCSLYAGDKLIQNKRFAVVH